MCPSSTAGRSNSNERSTPNLVFRGRSLSRAIAKLGQSCRGRRRIAIAGEKSPTHARAYRRSMAMNSSVVRASMAGFG
jgi:hypothetical protein